MDMETFEMAITINLLIWIIVTARALMESKLLSGTTLVVDRYSYSGVAFSAAKGLEIDWCKEVAVSCYLSPWLRSPHLNSVHGLSSCFIMVNVNLLLHKAAERGGYGGERYEEIEFQKKVAEHYYSLRDSTWKVVDGSVPMETVEEKLIDSATSYIQECQGNPLTNLAW